MNTTPTPRRPGRLARAWTEHIAWRLARRPPWPPTQQRIDYLLDRLAEALTETGTAVSR